MASSWTPHHENSKILTNKQFLWMLMPYIDSTAGSDRLLHSGLRLFDPSQQRLHCHLRSTPLQRTKQEVNYLSPGMKMTTTKEWQVSLLKTWCLIQIWKMLPSHQGDHIVTEGLRGVLQNCCFCKGQFDLRILLPGATMVHSLRLSLSSPQTNLLVSCKRF